MKKATLLSLSLMLMLLPTNSVAMVKPKESKTVEASTFNVDNIVYLQTAQLKFTRLQEQPKQPEPKKETYPKLNIPVSDDLQQYAWELSKEFGIPSETIWSFVRQETNGTYNPNLKHRNRNGTTDYGLMQLNNGGTMQWLAKMIGIDDFDWSNPKHNLRAGVWYLKYLKDTWTADGYGKDNNLMELVALAYNMGYGNAKSYIKSHDVFEWEYVNKIYIYEKEFKAGKEI
jgi:soluble lytic murein transglycosylase-like protein